MPALELADDPWSLAQAARGFMESLPALVNVHVCRHNWHVGIGSDGPAEWDRYARVKGELAELGLDRQLEMIENREHEEMQRLWQM
jgi:hypothetical protein